MARAHLILVAALISLPLVGLAAVLAAPEADVHWQHQPSHFWLVLLTAGLNAVLAYATGVAARRRGDRRVHLVSLSFLAASGFLAGDTGVLLWPARRARGLGDRIAHGLPRRRRLGRAGAIVARR